jgi:hypothetical protein
VAIYLGQRRITDDKANGGTFAETKADRGQQCWQKTEELDR